MPQILNPARWALLALLISNISVSSVSSDGITYSEFSKGMQILGTDKGQALTHFENAIKSDSNSYYGYLGRSIYHLKTGDLENARRDVDTAIQRDPQNGGPWQTSGEIHYEAKDYANAVNDSTRALQLHDGWTAAYYTRGSAYLRLGMLPEAIADLSDAIDRVPIAVNPLIARSEAYALLGRRLDAISDLRQALKIDPSREEVSTKLAVLMATEEHGENDDQSELDESEPVEGTASEQFSDEVNVAVKLQQASIGDLNIAEEILDSVIILRGLAGGMNPTPWITLRQWLSITLEKSAYRVVDVQFDEAQNIIAVFLKQPAEPTLTLGFSIDYGELYSSFLASGNKVDDANDHGGKFVFDSFLTRTVGFEFEMLNYK